jgi:hypothetical protein
MADSNKVDNGANTPPESDNSEMMQIPVGQLQEILNNQKAMEGTIKTLQKSNQALEKVVSQTRLQEAKENQDTDDRPRVHFKQLSYGVVVGWPDSKNKEDKDDIVNQLIINPNTNMPMGESIKFRYHLVDGSKTPLIDYTEFVRCTDLAYARIVEDKGDSVVVSFEDKSVSSTPIEVRKVFLNA